MPPIGVRRIFLDPLLFLNALVMLILSPLLLFAAFVADRFVPGDGKVMRMTKLLLTFMPHEVLGLIAAFNLWIVSGFGAKIHSPVFRNMHYALFGWWITGISKAVQKALGFTIDVPRHPPIDGPVIVFSRHAGPGDSIFLAGALLHDFERYPRIVGKKELEFAPFFDVMGHRLPMRFTHPT